VEGGSRVFPGELSVSADSRTLFLTDAGSNSIPVMDIERLLVEPARKPQASLGDFL
jgi:hypothetical protein